MLQVESHDVKTGDELQLEINESGDNVVIHFKVQKIMDEQVFSVFDQLYAALRTFAGKNIAIDFGGVNYLAQKAAVEIAHVETRVNGVQMVPPHESKLTLRNVGEDVRESLGLTCGRGVTQLLA